MKSTLPQTTSLQNCLTVPAMTGPRHTTGSVSFSVRKLRLMTSTPPLETTGSMPRSLPTAC